ncbi:MAG: efflux RND transporter periplasmic adaptor subunit [Polyangia bacterium]
MKTVVLRAPLAARSLARLSLLPLLPLLPALLLGGSGLGGAGCSKPQAAASEAAAPRPVTVAVARAARRDMPIYLDGIGTVTAYKTVTVRPQVDGRLERVRFREGATVKRGELLAEIDPRPFQAQLHQAEGALARDSALLRNAKLNVGRYAQLRKQDLIAPQQADDQQAAADQYEGAVAVDQAQVENARLQLSYTQITAPLDGVTGVRLIDEGNLVRAADPNGIVVITQLDPIAVMFTLPAEELGRIAPQQAAAPLKVEALARDGGTRLATGDLLVIDNQINQATATLRLKAVFQNPERTLWPNQFVKVRLLIEQRKGALVVPAAAVQRGPKGTFVYVVDSGQDGPTASPHPVEVALLSGADAVLDSGPEEGSQIVVEGQNQLKPGSRVQLAQRDDKKGGDPKGGDPKGGGPQDGDKKDGNKKDGEARGEQRGRP